MSGNVHDGADSPGSGAAFLTGLLAGVAIGSGLGLLFAATLLIIILVLSHRGERLLG
jgi:hypothetical protein